MPRLGIDSSSVFTLAAGNGQRAAARHVPVSVARSHLPRDLSRSP